MRHVALQSLIHELIVYGLRKHHGMEMAIKHLTLQLCNGRHITCLPLKASISVGTMACCVANAEPVGMGTLRSTIAERVLAQLCSGVASPYRACSFQSAPHM